ncbi:MAG TPA: DUF4389 domain-containing protein [Steroidobacteraceae bacterium]|nr:DUF4389 domain-containing protein [Steroidobacteraceae bacterium]
MSPEEPPPIAPSGPPALVPSPPPTLGARLLYMLLLTIVFWILWWIIGITVLAQLMLTLLAGRANPELARFGMGLANYSRQIIEFLTFVSDRIPFPFSEWPAP